MIDKRVFFDIIALGSKFFQTRSADRPVGFALFVAPESVVAPQGSE